MNAKVIFSFCLVAVALARPDDSHSEEGYGYSEPERPLSYHADSHEDKHSKGMPFDFSYEVEDHYKSLDFGHNSNSDGQVVKGEYRVLLPDGRTQIVTYTADHYKGYQAEVRYEGEATYPEPKPYAPAPSYGAPKESYGAPAPSYGVPKATYGTPASSSEEPEDSYEAPASLYGAPDH
ncbi:cuticle protein 19-like [Macrobrachium nipponense]|uniref:cuticle protein 19-like n=1 Tax=Macrobrachium nipponense TaxID=159736 RepID=UPI0030C87100